MSRRRRVALISLNFAEYSMLLAIALARKWDVLLVLREKNASDELPADWRDQAKSVGVEILVLDRLLNYKDVVSSAKIVRAVRKFKPDVLHCQESYYDPLMLAIPFLPLVPRILTVHDPEPHPGTDSKFYKPFSRQTAYLRLMRHWPTAVITHGNYLANRLAGLCPWLRNRIHAIPHGPLGGWCKVTTSLTGENKLLFFGRMNEYKGLGVFIDAVNILAAKGVRLTGVVAGMGPEVPRFRAIMEKSGCFAIHERYIHSSEVAKFFSEARVVVLPYIEGTQSGVAAMALGFGRPIIASAVGSIPELVRDGENGLLVPPGNAEALANSIEAVVCDDALAERLAAGSRALRDGPLSWSSIASATEGVYLSVLRS
jgi:glycosyltransferase involved in cell wall biosynthesis